MDIMLLFLAKPLDKHGIKLVHITYPPLDVLEKESINNIADKILGTKSWRRYYSATSL